MIMFRQNNRQRRLRINGTNKSDDDSWSDEDDDNEQDNRHKSKYTERRSNSSSSISAALVPIPSLVPLELPPPSSASYSVRDHAYTVMLHDNEYSNTNNDDDFDDVSRILNDDDQNDQNYDGTPSFCDDDDDSSSSSSSNNNKKKKNNNTTMLERISKWIARYPCLFLSVSLIVALGLSTVGMLFGDEFVVGNSNGGIYFDEGKAGLAGCWSSVDSIVKEIESSREWWSRGTDIANRERQHTLLQHGGAAQNIMQFEMIGDSDTIWNNLLSINQLGFDDQLLNSDSTTSSTNDDNNGGSGGDNIFDIDDDDDSFSSDDDDAWNDYYYYDEDREEDVDESRSRHHRHRHRSLFSSSSSSSSSSSMILRLLLEEQQQNTGGRNKQRGGGQRTNNVSSSVDSSDEQEEEEQQEYHRDLKSSLKGSTKNYNVGASSILAGCDLRFYHSLPRNSLWPVWKIQDNDNSSSSSSSSKNENKKHDDSSGGGTQSDPKRRSILDGDVIREICISEQITQRYLEEHNYCYKWRGCYNADTCLPPYSIVLYARLLIDGGLDVGHDDEHNNNGKFAMDCHQLANDWITLGYEEKLPLLWKERIAALKQTYSSSEVASSSVEDGSDLDEQYPFGFFPALIDTKFDTDGTFQYTSSIFDTGENMNSYDDLQTLYDNVDKYGHGNDQNQNSNPNLIEAAYDTPYEPFAITEVEALVTTDTTIAIGSFLILITISILIYTQSPLITLVGVLQLVASFPLSILVYKLILRLDFFPLLNFVGVFVVISLGVGDIYVAFNKWTNHRRSNLNYSTEDVAAVALPDSFISMFLTTITTAIAFFSMAICPVAPIRLFAIHCGFLSIFNYVLTVTFVFPALCIYDRALVKRTMRKRSRGNKNNCLRNCLWESWSCCTISYGILCCWCKCCTKIDVYDNVDVNNKNNSITVHSSNVCDEEAGNHHDPKMAYPDKYAVDDNDELSFIDETERLSSMAFSYKPEDDSDSDDNKNTEDGVNADDTENDKIIITTAADETVHDGATNGNTSNAVVVPYNFVERFMVGFAHCLYVGRWPLLFVCAVAFGTSCYFATTLLQSPDSSDVRLLGPNVEYEKAYTWRKQLVSSQLSNLSGSPAAGIIWGISPTDTGDHNNPAIGTKLVLDDTFEPSGLSSQIYLKNFCDVLFRQDFATQPGNDYICPMQRFDAWLLEQSQSDNSKKDTSSDYKKYCGNATQVPVPEENFHACISTWALNVQEPSVISRNGIVKILYIPLRTKAMHTNEPSYKVIDDEITMFTDFMTTLNNKFAPPGVHQGFFSSETYHRHDTYHSIMNSVYLGTGITLGAVAVMILLHSRSIAMMICVTLTIVFTWTSVTSILGTAFGWTLGFIEALCFVILIGVSINFVLHLAHAYSYTITTYHDDDDDDDIGGGGKVSSSRQHRTEYAIVTMGPSIVATAFTTACPALIVLYYCTTTVFQKFALLLVFTIVMATLGTFLFFVTLTNCFGPTIPHPQAPPPGLWCGMYERRRHDEES